jgi:hypothetical protein
MQGTTGVRLATRARRGAAASIIAAAVLTTLSIGTVSANHTFGTLDCGSAGTFEVEGHLPLGGNPIDRPSPWSGAFLLEDSSQVFRAFSNDHFGVVQVPASLSARPLVTCTLTSEGPMFDPPWTLVGMLLP